MTLVPVDDLIEMLSLRCPDLKARIRVIYTQSTHAYLFSDPEALIFAVQ